MIDTHQPRLNRELHTLLRTQRVAALGSLNAQGSPFVSMTPVAIDAERGQLIIHLSLLAPHTRNLLGNPAASLMVMQAEVATEPVHALPRVTFEGQALRLAPETEAAQRARHIYLQRFAQAAPMTELGDFSFFALSPSAARHVAGFGAARPLDAAQVADLLRGL